MIRYSFVLFFCMAAAAFSQPKYSVLHKFHVDGDGGWDYVTIDPDAGRLYIAHSTKVDVINVLDGSSIGVIDHTNGVHGVAIATGFGKGYTSNGKDTSVTVFDLKTLAMLKTIKVTGANPDAILFDPFSRRVFAFNGHSSNATVIDVRRDSVIGTIALDGRPEFAVTDRHGHIFLNIEDKNELAVIDPLKLTVLHYYKLGSGEEPSGLAIDLKTHRLFSVCSNNKMIVLNSMTGAVVATLPIGSHPDAVVFDPDYHRAFSSNGDGTITVIDEQNDSTFTVLGNFATAPGARTIALYPANHHVFLPTAEFGPAPEATKEHPHPRQTIKPGTFTILDVAPAP